MLQQDCSCRLRLPNVGRSPLEPVCTLLGLDQSALYAQIVWPRLRSAYHRETDLERVIYYALARPLCLDLHAAAAEDQDYLRIWISLSGFVRKGPLRSSKWDMANRSCNNFSTSGLSQHAYNPYDAMFNRFLPSLAEHATSPVLHSGSCRGPDDDPRSRNLRFSSAGSAYDLSRITDSQAAGKCPGAQAVKSCMELWVKLH